MKRCPQCEFIYEDDQSLCDMDGILLVFDSQKLPKPKTSAQPQWRSRGVTVGASAVLAIVLSLVYYVSTHQHNVTPVNSTPSPATNAAQPASSELPVVSIEAVEAPKEEPKGTETTEAKPAPEVKSNEQPEIKAVPASNAASKQLKEKPKTKSPQKVSGSQPTSQNDSKLGSLLKKTGNVLKKPFKF